MRRFWYRDRPPRSVPREVKGGIKAQSKRGQFGTTWWGRRWVNVLESFDIAARLGRGRNYARDGQVLSIDIEKGRVRAKVQGSRPEPYTVTIELKVLSKAEWARVRAALASQAVYTAKLLAGEMPEGLDRVFGDARVRLFPGSSKDLVTDCTCPDWSNPCKHIAAVYYLLAEEFDRDPFLLLRLRGMSREELLAGLSAGAPPTAATPSAPTPSAPLPASAKEFWAPPPPLPPQFFGEVVRPPVAAALPKRLGGFPFWRGETPFLEVIEPLYREAGARGLYLFQMGTDATGSTDAA
jgi:uncharacterized Zn finger protein